MSKSVPPRIWSKPSRIPKCSFGRQAPRNFLYQGNPERVRSPLSPFPYFNTRSPGGKGIRRAP